MYDREPLISMYYILFSAISGLRHAERVLGTAKDRKLLAEYVGNHGQELLPYFPPITEARFQYLVIVAR